MTKIDHKFPEVDNDKCITCGSCASVCPKGVFVMKAKAVVTKPEECIECNACVNACPAEAIRLVESK